MSGPAFKEMVKIAKEIIQSQRFCDGYDRFERNADFHAFIADDDFISYEAARMICGFTGSPLSRENPPQFSEEAAQKGWQVLSEDIVAASKCCPDDFRRLRHHVARSIELGKALHPIVAAWLVSFLREEVAEPKRGGRPPRETGARDDAIRTAIRHLLDLGAKHAGRNPESPQTSPCDAVAVALRELDIWHASYESIQDIWADRVNLVIELDE